MPDAPKEKSLSATPESKDLTPEIRKELDALKESIKNKSAKDAINQIIRIADKNNGKFPDAMIAHIIEDLTDQEEKTLRDFFDGKNERAKAGTLLNRLAQQVSGPAAPTMAASSAKGQVLAFIDQAIKQFDVPGMLSSLKDKLPKDGIAGALAARFLGNKDPVAQLNIVRKIAMSFVARLTTQFAFAMKSFGLEERSVTTAAELYAAQFGIEEAQTTAYADYKAAFKKRFDEASSYANFRAPKPNEIAAILRPKSDVQAAAAKPTEKPAERKSGDKTETTVADTANKNSSEKAA